VDFNYPQHYVDLIEDGGSHPDEEATDGLCKYNMLCYRLWKEHFKTLDAERNRTDVEKFKGMQPEDVTATGTGQGNDGQSEGSSTVNIDLTASGKNRDHIHTNTLHFEV